MDKILDVSRDLVLSEGARSVTVDRIVTASGAPKGSVYHRFSSVNDLLATMWLRGVRRSQARFLEPLDADADPMPSAVAAGLAIHDFAKRTERTRGCLPRYDEKILLAMYPILLSWSSCRRSMISCGPR